MNVRRGAGLLVHPTSLPGPFGIGDTGADTVRFLDWAAEAGQSVWQVLPVGPTGSDRSPYSALSAFAGNPLLISPQGLARRGWLSPSFLDTAPRCPVERVAFEQVARWKQDMLLSSWAWFTAQASRDDLQRFEAFCSDPLQSYWLEDWTMFAALRERHAGRAWPEWDEELRDRRPAALRGAARELAESLRFQRYVQFAFFTQWGALRRSARIRRITLLGDLPYYCAHDSADVWSHRDLFELNEAGRPLVVSGVPPDYFSATGQLWGQPVYRWERMADDGFRFWVARLRAALALADQVRLDHFRAFDSFWVVDASEPTAANGHWAAGPGRAPFVAAREELGSLPLIAEDLGDITAAVEALRNALALPGMKVLQFGLGGQIEHLPEAYGPQDVAYTGTHDNDTARGWFESLDPTRRAEVLRSLETGAADVVQRMVELLYRSRAGLVVVPLQDVLDLGSGARMNVPGVAQGNWRWRLAPRSLTLERAAALRRLGARTDRLL